MRFEIYAIEQNLGTLLTSIRFRVFESISDLERVKDDCRITVEGRYNVDDEDLPSIIESKYRQAMGL
jgi:hypothetical protein